MLLAEGVLTKSCRTGVKPRQFFLFNDILVYGSILVRGLRYSRQHILPLQEVSVRMLGEGEGEVDYGWVINTRTKSFTVGSVDCPGEAYKYASGLCPENDPSRSMLMGLLSI